MTLTASKFAQYGTEVGGILNAMDNFDMITPSEEPADITFNQYQQETAKTNLGKGDANQLYYLCLGIGGESGEILEKVKKILRNKGGEYDASDVESLAKEIGDVFWYLSELSSLLGLSLGNVAMLNVMKLRDRYERNVIASEGDNR